MDIDFNGAYAEAALWLHGLEVTGRDAPLAGPDRRPLFAGSSESCPPREPGVRDLTWLLSTDFETT